jgi:exonuclease I
MTSFVFYDTETTGTDTVFDQILQFAAIRTDENLREVERFEVRCRLLPHVVPAAGALIATGMSPRVITDTALPTHCEAARQIARRLADWSHRSSSATTEFRSMRTFLGRRSTRLSNQFMSPTRVEMREATSSTS